MEFAPELEKDEELAWLAGFLDGEGCIQITRILPPHTSGNYPEYYVRISVTSTTYSIMEHLKGTYGGFIHSPRKNKPHHKLYWRWVIQYSAAERLLEVILPYMKIKGEEAKVALELRNLKNTDRKPPSVELLEQRRYIFRVLQELKHG